MVADTLYCCGDLDAEDGSLGTCLEVVGFVVCFGFGR